MSRANCLATGRCDKLAGMRSGSPKQVFHDRREKWDTGQVLLPEEIAEHRIDFAEVFGNTRPVELEIGSGKGTFLLARAPAREEINFLGLEYARSYAAYCADRIHRAGLTNVRMLCAEAGQFVQDCLPDASLLRVHVYFPDPWPKRKHNRRRLIQPAFLDEMRRVLRPGGLLQIVTDHLDYFQWMRRVLVDTPGFARIPFPSMSDDSGEIVGTNFERKYIAQGRPFFCRAFLRYV